MVIFRNNILKHRVDWETAMAVKQQPHYRKRRALEAIHIHISGQTTNLDCGLSQESIWLSFLNPDTCLPYPPFIRIQFSTIVLQWSVYVCCSVLVQLTKVYRMDIQNCVLVLATNKLINLEFNNTYMYVAMSLYNTELKTALTLLRLII